MLPKPVMPLWACLFATAWTAVLIPVYWKHIGPGNFLWFSDIALFMTIAALWTNSRWLLSMAAVSVLLLETVWNIDFVLHLLNLRATGMTDYMFDTASPRLVRGLSLFHVWLPPLWVWMVWRLGYERRAVWAMTGLCWIVLPASYLLTDPAKNVNWVYRLGSTELPIPPLVYLGALMLAMPLLVYHPTHLVLQWLSRRLS